MHRGLFNSKLLDSINFAALYLLPLLVMTVSVFAVVSGLEVTGERYGMFLNSESGVTNIGRMGEEKGDESDRRERDWVNL